MRYYNEAKTERSIRRKARIWTFVTMFILTSGIFFMTTNIAKDIWEEEIKEWFNKEEPQEDNSKKKKKA